MLCLKGCGCMACRVTLRTIDPCNNARYAPFYFTRWTLILFWAIEFKCSQITIATLAQNKLVLLHSMLYNVYSICGMNEYVTAMYLKRVKYIMNNGNMVINNDSIATQISHFAYCCSRCPGDGWKLSLSQCHKYPQATISGINNTLL